MGSESLVSQPSTGTWKPSTIAIAIQYCRLAEHAGAEPQQLQRHDDDDRQHREDGVLQHQAPRSTGAVAVVRRRAQPAQHVADRLVGQQPADRDDDEEDELLQRHRERQQDAGGVALAVAPVPRAMATTSQTP